MPPLVSIIIPCFNCKQFIADTIESALRQTYPVVEVIVIDDGSTDGSDDVIATLSDQIVSRRIPNQGACVARNIGLRIAQGQYIQYLDADDLLHHTKLDQQMDAILRSDADTVFCDGSIIPKGDLMEKLYRRPFRMGDDPVEFMCSGILQTSAPIHRKIDLDRIGGWDESLPCAQDLDLHLRLACDGMTFEHLPETLYIVRRVAGSISSNYVEVMEQIGGIFQKAKIKLEAEGTLTDRRSRALAGRLATTARHLLAINHNDLAKKYFVQAKTIHPDGGLDLAYNRKSRALRKVIGSVWTERFVSLRRLLLFDHRTVKYLSRSQGSTHHRLRV